jgi:hypothetical protein
MDRSKTVEQLKKLAVTADGRSESSRLGDIISEVEAALKAGVKRKIVLETLHQHYGFKMSMSGFEKALSQIRKKKNEKQAETTKKGKENSAGSQQLITRSDATSETTSVAVTTLQNALTIIHEDEDNDEGVQTAFQPHDLKKVWSHKPNMAELKEIGKQLYKKQKEDAKNENNSN